MLQAACCKLHVASCMLQAACCKLLVASSMLQAACCMLHCHLSLAPLVRLLLELALGVRHHTLQRSAAPHKRCMTALSHCCHGAKAWKPDIYDATCNRQARMGKHIAHKIQHAPCSVASALGSLLCQSLHACRLSAGAPRARARLPAPALALAWLQLHGSFTGHNTPRLVPPCAYRYSVVLSVVPPCAYRYSVVLSVRHSGGCAAAVV
jgi:hypothetical protein